jgi:broad specificity phosphatase PhoE
VATRILLVRHAAHAWLGHVLVGRKAGVALDDRGVAQARHLAGRLAGCGITRIKSSPQRRAWQTALPLAAAAALAPEIATAFDEIDFGAWTGRSFEALASDPRWQRWNTQRGDSRAPGGESMGEVAQRVIGGIKAAAAANPGGCVAIVSHAEPIRAAVLHFRGLPLDAFDQIAIEPASLTVLDVDGERGTLLGVNQTADEMMVPA